MKSIGYDKGVINHLVVVNDSKKGMVVYSVGKAQTESEKAETESPAPKKDPNTPITAKQVLTLKMMCKKHEMPESKIFEKYQKTKIEELTISDWADFGKTGQELLIAWDKEHK